MAAGLIVMLLWVKLTNAGKAAPLVLLGLLALAVHLWLRRHAGRTLPRESEPEFLEACHLHPGREADAIQLRVEIANAFGIPADRVTARSRLRELMGSTAWFGSDLLALADVQASVEKLAGRGSRTEVKPDSTVLDLVRVVGGGERDRGA